MKIYAQLQPKRLTSIDFARGLVVVVMALDHCRDLIYEQGMSRNPLDLNTTTPLLFFTRFITHFCAPVFVFLSGTSAYLLLRKHNNPPQTRRFLAARGVWLMVLELTVVSFGIWTDPKFRTVLLQVIFAIGAGFLILSQLSRWPARVVGWMGLLIVLLHDALPRPGFVANFGAEFAWALLFDQGFFSWGANRGVIVGYALVPWLGVMLAGFGFGSVFEAAPPTRRRILASTGAAALLLFVLLRGLNSYGDPAPWSTRSSQLFTLLSFLNVSKYPPSLLYTLLTLGPLFLLLWLAEGRSNRLIRFFVTYGKAPLFFYLLHWYVFHALLFIILAFQGFSWRELTFGLMKLGRPETGGGLGLGGTYVAWICVVAALYPFCRWFGAYKAAHPEKKWLAYL